MQPSQNLPNLRKRVELFWGPTPLSFLRFLTVKSLCVLNPNWEVRLTHSRSALANKPWVEHNRQDFEAYEGENYWSKLDFPNLKIVEERGDKEICPSHQSNFFKWGKLATENCVYSDMDILYVRPLDEIYPLMNSCHMSINHNGEYFSHGFMSSKGGNPFFEGLYKFLLQRFQPKIYQGAGSNMIYAYLGVVPALGLLALEDRFPQITIWNFPNETVYPWLSQMIPAYFQELHKELPEGCVGLHWYAGSPLAQRMNREITQETIHTIQSTICYHARRFCL